MIDRIISITNAKKQGKGYIGHCPAHEDRKPSLSISEGEDSKLLVYCHRGCSQEAVIEALEGRGCWPEGQEAEEPRVYDYTDEAGTPLYCKLRYPNKNWGQMQYKDGGLVSGLEGARRVLYNTVGIETAKREKRAVIFVEGEKDANTLNALGFIATTNDSGAGKGKVKPELLAQLTGCMVVLLGDNDEAGEMHMDFLSQQLVSYASKIVRVDLPKLMNNKPVKDITDYLEATKGGETEVKDLIRQGRQLWPTKVVTSYGDLMQMDLPEPETWMAGFISPSEATLLVALPGVGKTWFALACALALADGKQAIGPYIPKKKCNILLVDFEMGPVRLRQRLEALRQGYGLEADIMEQIGILSPELCSLNNLTFQELGMPETEKLLINASQGYDVVIIDNINAAYSMSEDDENSPKFWVKPQGLTFALKRAGKASMMIHHATKGNPQNPAGSGKNTRFFDNVIALVDTTPEEDFDSKRVKVHFKKSRNFFPDKAMQPELSLQSMGNRTFWNDYSSGLNKSFQKEEKDAIRW